MIGRFPFDGLEVEFADEGPSDGEGVIVLLHGFASDKDSWLPLRSRMAESLRVVSVDLPGFGGTPAPKRPADAEMANVSRMLVAMWEALEVKGPTILGYSMGGRQALHLAVNHPGRVGSLILIGASAGLQDPVERAERRRRDEELAAYIEAHSIEEFVDRWQSQPVFESQQRLPADVRNAIRTGRLACSRQGLATSLRSAGTGVQPWLGDRLGELDIPVVVVAGELDGKFRAIGETLVDAIKSATLQVADGAGHAVHIESPDWLWAVVDEHLEGLRHRGAGASAFNTGERQCR